MKRSDSVGVRPALLGESLSGGNVRCLLCAHRCLIKPSRLGICKVRMNRDGVLYTRVYGMAVSIAVDPIEKKPLFHFYPGSNALSLATVGCNFGCLNCQNYGISHWPRGKDMDLPVPGQYVPPEVLVQMAIEEKCNVIAYTYTEPTVYFEYALDTARLAAEHGIQNVFVTNGYMTAEAVALCAPYLHAANVDLKGLDDRRLKREIKATSGPVLRTIEDFLRRGIWVEVTTLIIPGSNDQEDELRAIARKLVSMSPDIPWHVSRFRPLYRMTDRPCTPAEILHRAKAIGHEEGLRYVYTGNLPGDEGETTRCPSCNSVVLDRFGYSIRRRNLEAGTCASCGRPIAGRGLP